MSQAIKKLHSSHKLALTGTPIENSLIDLWAQFNFINPGLLGNLSAFRNNYINKIHKEKNKEMQETLQRLIHPFLLRRTKEEVTPELPPLSQEIVYYDMTEEQEKEIDYFSQAKDVNAFLISLKVGGTGLNLTEADYVFIIDPWWNPVAEMQAVSRAHRIGQNKKVMVYRFISSHSIEEKIISLQEEKNRLSETFITSNNPLENLNSREIEGLFE